MGHMSDSIEMFVADYDMLSAQTKNSSFREGILRKAKQHHTSSGKSTPQKIRKNEMQNLSQGMTKAMQSMFAMIENVSIDMMTGTIGIKSVAGTLTMNEEGSLDQNPLEFFSIEIPAFASLTPISEAKKGDLLVQDGKAVGFLLEDGMGTRRGKSTRSRVAKTAEADLEQDEPVQRGEVEVLKIDGHVGRFRPRTISMMGIKNGLMIVKPFGGMFGNQQAQGGNSMMQMIPMLMMMKGESKGGMKDMLPMMMMMQSMGGQQAGGMNPLMLMAMLGDNTPFK